MNRLAIKHALLDHGMTLVVLARTAGLSYDRIVRIVNGYRRPRPEEVRAIADALGMKACELGADVLADPGECEGRG